MTPRLRIRRSSHSTPPRGRRGVVVGLLLVSLVFLTGFMALGMNVIRLRQVQTQMRGACQAAALAAAAHLLDEHSLYRTPRAGNELLTARAAACGYAQSHLVDGRRLQLDPNLPNLPHGDLVVGWTDPAGPVKQKLNVPTAEIPHAVNTVRVRCRLDRNVANQVTLWFGNLVGMSSGEVGVTAQAAVDQRVVGFRPEPGVKAPVSPLIAEYGPWMEQASAAVDPELNDLYAVDPQTGTITAGADGIPEITLCYGSQFATATAVKPNSETESEEADAADADDAPTTTPGRCAPLRLWNEENLSYIWPVRAREGLSLGDLRDYGNELIVQPGGTPVGVEPNMPDELPYGLMDAMGQVRAWPLGEPGAETWRLLGFGAARIVAIRRTDGDVTPTWTFVLQPATLVSSQAVADVAGALNPWIAKLELTE